MKFDPERVMAHAKALDSLRPVGSEGARSAAEDIVRHFELAGLGVERNCAPTLATGRLIFLFAFGYLGFGIAKLSSVNVAVFACLITIGLIGVWFWVTRRDRDSGIRQHSDLILGKSKHEVRPSARVILVTRLTTSSDLFARYRILVVAVLFGLVGLVAVIKRFGDALRSRPSVGFATSLVLGISALLLMVLPPIRRNRRCRRDNRTGLAVLAELARTWPGGLGERVETWFVSTPNPNALDLYLSEQVRADQDMAILVITIDSPGVGPLLVLTGDDSGANLAGEAARDLWIPHRRPGWLASRLNHLFGGPAVLTRLRDSVGIAGSRGDQPIDPAVLAATAQLVIEIVLRWAKQHPNAESQGESLARSSQKPG